MLRFLDVLREMRPTTSNIEAELYETSGEENHLQETGSESSNSNSKPASRRDQSMALFQRSLINNIEKSSQDDSDSDKQFLLSLLPQIKKMSEAQNFDFRLDIMNLVKNINLLQQVQCNNITSCPIKVITNKFVYHCLGLLSLNTVVIIQLATIRTHHNQRPRRFQLKKILKH